MPQRPAILKFLMHINVVPKPEIAVISVAQEARVGGS